MRLGQFVSRGKNRVDVKRLDDRPDCRSAGIDHRRSGVGDVVEIAVLVDEHVFAANLVAFGNQAGNGNALLPDLDAGDVGFTAEQRAVTGGNNACVIIATASVDFSAIFGDTIVPFLDLDPITLNATVEERYHGE